MLARTRRGRLRDCWWACAVGEPWLQRGQGQPAKPLWRCRRTVAKPLLDGKLDDTIWQRAGAVRLASSLRDDTAWPATVLLAFDDEYLYLAVRCRKASGAAYPTADGPRPRDSDLSRHDHVRLLIDVDRDWSIYYELALDHRGFTREELWHDATWNPDWFVASASDDGQWICEAAIPLSELVATAPKAGDAWAIGVQRTVPAVGFQSWSRPAAVEPIPKGFGYLKFE